MNSAFKRSIPSGCITYFKFPKSSYTYCVFAHCGAGSLGPAWIHRSSHPPRTAWAAPARWDAYKGIRGLRAMRSYDRAAHVVVVGKNLFFGSSVDDAVHCLDTRTGRERWVFVTDGPVRIAPTVFEGRVYFGSDDGRAYCVGAADGKLVWRSDPPKSEPPCSWRRLRVPDKWRGRTSPSASSTSSSASTTSSSSSRCFSW